VGTKSLHPAVAAVLHDAGPPVVPDLAVQGGFAVEDYLAPVPSFLAGKGSPVHQHRQQNRAKISHNFHNVNTLTQYLRAGCPGIPLPAIYLFRWLAVRAAGKAFTAKPLEAGRLRRSNAQERVAGESQSYRIPTRVTTQKRPLTHGRHV
jgi:hypothetical protein